MPCRSAAACSCRPARAPASGSACTRHGAHRDRATCPAPPSSPAPAARAARHLRRHAPSVPAGATWPRESTSIVSLHASFLRLLCWRLLLITALAAAFGGTLVAAQESRRQLIDQILQHERILHELDAIALLQ